MRHGFSLVELSIVLVILGLLVGGVLSGQSLIHAAELRSVSTEYNRYYAAAHTFRDKYFAYPGDISNATKFWGATASCPGTAGTGTQTCDGNGDGLIGPAGAASQYGEMQTFWQHLANAGLIEGTYTGIAGTSGGYDVTPGINEPRSKFSSASGWMVLNWGIVADGNWGRFGGDYTNAISFGGASGGNYVSGRIMTATDAWNIDTKMDDGNPAAGKVWAGAYGPNCTITTSTAYDKSTAAYYLTGSTLDCPLYFKNFL